MLKEDRNYFNKNHLSQYCTIIFYRILSAKHPIEALFFLIQGGHLHTGVFISCFPEEGADQNTLLTSAVFKIPLSQKEIFMPKWHVLEKHILPAFTV